MQPIILTIEVLERYPLEGMYSQEWWKENMPDDSTLPITFGYRRTNPRIDDIERIIEIPGNDKECKVRFYSGQTMTVLANFDEICIKFNDLCNGLFEDEE